MPEKILILEEQEFERFRKYCKGKGFDLSYRRGDDIKISRFSSNENIKRELEKEAEKRGTKIVRLENRRAVLYDVAIYEEERWNESYQKIYEEFKK